MIEDLKKEKTRLERQLAAATVAASTNKHTDGNKNALAFITDELNEAHVREQMLEELLTSCRNELFVCKQQLESLEDEYDRTGGLNKAISNANKSNDDLVAKNKKTRGGSGNPQG